MSMNFYFHDWGRKFVDTFTEHGKNFGSILLYVCLSYKNLLSSMLDKYYHVSNIKANYVLNLNAWIPIN